VQDQSPQRQKNAAERPVAAKLRAREPAQQGNRTKILSRMMPSPCRKIKSLIICRLVFASRRRIMALQNDFELLSHLGQMPDFRVTNRSDHKLTDILFVALCGAVAGCDSWVEIQEFATQRIDWFQKFIPLENGVPSHDTFGRVFRRLDTSEFLSCMMKWTEHLHEKTDGRIIAIDGKTVRGSFDKATGKAALHLVSAWATENRLVLGQVATDAKSNEITAIPQLLRLLDLKGATVTIDAMGCQKEIAAQIIAQEADYVLPIKDNHPKLHAAVQECFLDLAEEDFCDPLVRRIVRNERNHGRQERREYTIFPVPENLEGREQWEGLTSLGMVLRRRIVDGKETVEIHYYLVSGEPKVKAFAAAVREHWGIENSLHWTLDVTFSEDGSRIRKDAAPETTALLRRWAVSMLQQDTSSKKSLRLRRKAAGWNTDLLEEILFGKAEN
jgi:predicted transposase YbfD/YdcC